MNFNNLDSSIKKHNGINKENKINIPVKNNEKPLSRYISRRNSFNVCTGHHWYKNDVTSTIIKT